MDRKTQIVRRATELFNTQGYAHTSLEEIAKQVSLRREGIYYYFKDKSDILTEIIAGQSKALLAGLLAVVARDDLSFEERLRSAIRNHLERFNPHYLEMAVATREASSISAKPKFRELRAIWKAYDKALLSLIVGGQKAGAFRKDVEPKITAFGIIGMWQWLSRWYHPEGRVTMDQVVEIFYTIAATGILHAKSNGRVAKPGGATVQRKTTNAARRARSPRRLHG
jgi:AcrR family transcriptional regulator